MKTLVKIVATFALLASIAWCRESPGWETYTAVACALAALIGLFVTDKQVAKATYSQSVGEGGVGIQAGGNVQASNLNVGKGNKNKH